MPACGSPMLFAACHVLLRRLVPWHPPCALVRLIFLRMTFVIVDPETNCLIYFSGKLLPIFLATGLQRLFLVFLLYVRLSRCMRNLFRSGTNPENDTDQRMTVISFLQLLVALFPTSEDVIDLWMKLPISLQLAP